jgi:tetratricopeptide (TPR) repeat protein
MTVPKKTPQNLNLDEDWLAGKASLGAAANWTPDEMRVVAELAFGLAEQGRNEEAITMFEGLVALAPATAYFQSALGALKLRTGQLEDALEHFNTALQSNPRDIPSLTNRGEVLFLLGRAPEARADFEDVLSYSDGHAPDQFAIRARALLTKLNETV